MRTLFSPLHINGSFPLFRRTDAAGTQQRENFGAKSATQNTLSDIKSGVLTILRDHRVLTLGVTSCFFEGAMYLFIFFWSAALKSARAQSAGDGGPAASEELPYGVIFSSFMCAMMGGSALFSLAAARHTRESAATLLLSVILVASACFSAAAVLRAERLLFWVLCVVEACIGVYFPSMSFLKSELVEDGVRGSVYSILRFPLNVFVVVVHSLDAEGTCREILSPSFSLSSLSSLSFSLCPLWSHSG